MPDFPTSLIDFQRRFLDEAACAAWLFEAGTATSNEPGRGALNHWRRGREPVTGRAFLNQLNALFNRVQYRWCIAQFRSNFVVRRVYKTCAGVSVAP